MKSTLSRILKACGAALLLLTAFFFCAWFCGGAEAEAETYSVGNNVFTVTLDYGAAPRYPILLHQDSGKYFKITSYYAEGKNGSIIPLVEGGAVTASPGTYRLQANINVTLCDQSGNLLSGDTFDGVIRVDVQKKILPVKVYSSSLEKIYGQNQSGDLSWDFKEEADRDGAISILFASAGFAATAHAGTYPLAAATVTKGETDVSALYDVRLYPQEGEGSVSFTVTPAPITVTLAEEATVPFNHYKLSDGESVVTSSAAGVNGETVTVYYRLKTPVDGVLTVGEKYQVEGCRYEISSSGGTASYALTDASDYLPELLYDKDEVVAGKGTLTVFQNVDLIEERRADPSQFYCSFAYDYLDPVVEYYRGEVWIHLAYFGRDVILCGEIDRPDGAVPAGAYPLTLISFDCEDLTSVLFDGQILLTVNKRVLAYGEADVAEVMTGNSFVKRISLTFASTAYAFDLTADLSGRTVGETISYASFTAVTDPNFDLDFAAATVTLVKRSTGIAIVPFGRDHVFYGEEYAPAALYADHGTPAARVVEEPVLFSYKVKGATQLRNGLPAEVGSYVVYCSIDSDVYEAAEISVDLTVAKRPVAAYYLITSAKKPYGQSFDFGRNVQLTSLYDYDENTHEVDRSNPIAITDGMVGGMILTSTGADAGQTVGEYEFDFSGATAQHYRIAAAIVFDLAAGDVAETFSVVKADAPPKPDLSIEITGRELKVSADGPIRGEISLRADYGGAKVQSGSKGLISFTQLTYGAVYHLRVRAEDNQNYESASTWSEVTKAIPFAKPEVAVSTLLSNGLVVTCSMRNAVDGYVIQHRVGSSGEWKDGTEVTGLKPDSDYTLSFRAKNEVTTGAENTFSVHTLRAPVDKKNLEIELDRTAGTLSVVSSVRDLEYRLLSSSGDPLNEEWAPLGEFEKLDKDATYLLQVRLAASEGVAASEIAEITIDTHEKRDPFSFAKLFTAGFLFVVGGALLIAAIILLVFFVKWKKKSDREELGGE